MQSVTRTQIMYEGLDPDDVLEFLAVLSYCEKKAIAARESGEICAVPMIQLYGPDAEGRRGLVRATMLVQSWSASENQMHTLMPFPITRTWNSSSCYMDDYGHSTLWGFMSEPSATHGLFSIAEANAMFPAIFDNSIKALTGWINLLDKQENGE